MAYPGKFFSWSSKYVDNSIPKAIDIDLFGSQWNRKKKDFLKGGFS